VNKKRWIWVGILFGAFLVAFFVGGPALQGLIEKHQPYLIVDPEVKSETGCEYDYLTYLPVEVTGIDPEDGVMFPVTEIPVEYKDYVHYPDTWENPFNPFNPENKFSSIVKITTYVLLVVVLIAFFVYIGILWRKGTLKKMADKMRE